MEPPALTTLPGVIDPTLNVAALVAALEEKTKELAQAETRYQNDMRALEARYRDHMRSAETRRIDQLAALRQTYDFKIADMLMRANEKALDLLAGQAKEFKADATASFKDLQEKSWTAQGETKRGGDVWIKLTSAVSILIALGAFVFAIRSSL